ncbi:sensor histidine kinase [Catenuloplanes indicus]|uniref:histidine kinase n=1 Tax=Catenuloplanes indicus TaxID=137267 RepID=A0AAE4AVG3_9ACTN|nr:sensor histidine kinase [Catenuloplanes indicus]MDQ0363904.1 signal transduction histidine kinase [Catenuloplanes indicus]
MHTPTAWAALRRRDLLLTAWPWRSAAYLTATATLGVIGLIVVLSLFLLGTATVVLLVGVPLLCGVTLAGVPAAVIERRLLPLVDSAPIDGPHRVPAEPGLWCWLRTRWREPGTWRELGHLMLSALVLWLVEVTALLGGLVVPLALLVTPLLLAFADEEGVKVLKTWQIVSWGPAWATAVAGLVLLVPGGYVLTGLAAARAVLSRRLLGSTQVELTERVQELSRSRARLVDAFEAERRRIERDLHDGAQQRLLSLSMTLGLAEVCEPDEVGALVAQARDEARLALEEIRELIRGIHPQVLTDRGLPAAVGAVADRSAVPVQVRFDLPDRLPSAVESTAYFAVCEALANVARHSGAGSATVDGRIDAGRLVVEVRDDGVGGADAGAGTGLAGLADRLAVLDGTVILSSPRGGPTLLRLEVPCRPTAPYA